jgi:protocatechuate 3,4-dioxygenase beta subunit
MKLTHSIFIILFLICGTLASQNNRVGGPCEGCEAIYEYGNKTLKSIDTFPQFNNLPNPIKISGTVYQNDGLTPASGIILYVYHTDNKGVYPSNNNSKGWERRHGYLRAWLKTDERGKYTFYTSRPASYPNSTIPQHIHITVKEPDKNEYYVEDFYFKDDPHITKNILNRKQARGGSGVIFLYPENNIQSAERTIILGLNIPNYN